MARHFATLMSITLVTSLALALASAVRPMGASVPHQQEILRGGFINNCDFFEVISHGEAYGHLQATCNMNPANPASEVATTLDLNTCLGNYNNHLGWGYMGGAFASCTGCKSRWANTRYLDCSCGSIDLNEGVYVTSSGAIACFSEVGTLEAVPY